MQGGGAARSGVVECLLCPERGNRPLVDPLQGIEAATALRNLFRILSVDTSTFTLDPQPSRNAARDVVELIAERLCTTCELEIFLAAANGFDSPEHFTSTTIPCVKLLCERIRWRRNEQRESDTAAENEIRREILQKGEAEIQRVGEMSMERLRNGQDCQNTSRMEEGEPEFIMTEGTRHTTSESETAHERGTALQKDSSISRLGSASAAHSGGWFSRCTIL